MFAHECTECRQRKLVFPSQITSMINSERGIEISFTCWCGADQALLTGRRAVSSARATVAA